MKKQSEIQICTLKNYPFQKYILYLPDGIGVGKQVVASVHGLSRNTDSHLNLNIPFANLYDKVLVVPCFEEEQHPSYNCLGISPAGLRADIMFNEMLDEVREKFDVDTSKIFLMGYSAGAQFAHRYTYFNPQRVLKLVLGAAGYYTLPTYEMEYPEGIATQTFNSLTKVDLNAYLQIPICLLVGKNDILRSGNFRKDELVDRLQGHTRVERGLNWINTIKKLSAEHALSTHYYFDTIPNSAHGFETCMENGLGEKAWNFLFSEV